MDTAIPSDLLAAFYRDNHLPADGGQSSSFVKIQLAPKLAVYFPNFDSRRRAVLRHDVHHMVTGYSASSLAGESEISAWEIASGCRNYPAAFFINIAGVLSGFPFNLRRQLHAFARGRHTGNLYHDKIPENIFLQTPVGELKKQLQLDQFGMKTRIGVSDVLLYLLLLLFGAVYAILLIPVFGFVLMYTLYILLSGKDRGTVRT